MRKYRILDDDLDYPVEVVEEKEDVYDEDIEEKLTAEEISALKGLAAVADKLMALLSTTDSDEDEKETCDEDEDEDEKMTDEDEVEEVEEEEVVDTKKSRDSKKSIGALENRKSKVDDSLVDEVADAWQKRYGGNK